MSSRRPSSSVPPPWPDTAQAPPPEDDGPASLVGRRAPDGTSPPNVATDVDDATAAPWPWRLYAGLIAYLGLPIIAAWIAAAVGASAFLPDFGADTGFGLVDLIPGNTAALRAQAVENHLFGASLSDAQSVVVLHESRGLQPASLVQLAEQARAVDGSRPVSAAASLPAFALPLVNVAGLVPSSRGTSTTAVVYLFFPSIALTGDITSGTQRYAARCPTPRAHWWASPGRCRRRSARATPSRTRCCCSRWSPWS